MSKIPKSKIKELMKEITKGTDVSRISQDSVDYVSEKLEEIGRAVAKDSVKFAKEDGRDVVKKEDVEKSESVSTKEKGEEE